MRPVHTAVLLERHVQASPLMKILAWFIGGFLVFMEYTWKAPAEQRVAWSKSTPHTHLVNICSAAYSYTVGTPDQKVKDIFVADLFVRPCVWILSFFWFSPPTLPPALPLKDFPALQPSAAWLMFTRWLIWLFRVTLAQQQVISGAISTSRLMRDSLSLRERAVLAPRLESWKQRARRCCVFTALFDLCLVCGGTSALFSPFFLLSSSRSRLPPSASISFIS